MKILQITTNFILGACRWIKKRSDSLLTICGLLVQVMAAIILSQAVFPTGVETGGEGWSTHLTGFNPDIYQSGLKWLIFGLLIQILLPIKKFWDK